MDGAGDGDGGGRVESSSRLRLILVRVESFGSIPRNAPGRWRADFREPSSAVWEAIDVSSSWTEVPKGSGLILRVEDC